MGNLTKYKEQYIMCDCVVVVVLLMDMWFRPRH